MSLSLTRVLGSLALLAMAATGAPAAPAAPAWSKAVGGVRGRLVATSTTDPAGKPQLAIALELENMTDVDAPVPIRWSDDLGAMLKFRVEDATGTPLPDSAVGGSYASGPPYTLLLPHASMLRKTVSTGVFEYVGPGRTLIRPLTFQAWDLPATHGPLFLRATMTPVPPANGHPDPKAWAGPLDLPPVPLP